MIRIFLTLLLAVTVWAANPKMYAGVGDPIYDTMEQVKSLVWIESMRKYRQGIGDFLAACQTTKEQGLALEKSHAVESERKGYLQKLRTLTREHDFFVNAARKVFEQTMKTGNYEDFSKLIETGLIDTATNRQEITAFYETHRGTHRIEVLDAYLMEDQALREREMSEKEKRRERYERYKKQRIEQINRRQKAEKASKRREIEAETERQKQEAYRMQEEELRQNR